MDDQALRRQRITISTFMWVSLIAVLTATFIHNNNQHIMTEQQLIDQLNTAVTAIATHVDSCPHQRQDQASLDLQFAIRQAARNLKDIRLKANAKPVLPEEKPAETTVQPSEPTDEPTPSTQE